MHIDQTYLETVIPKINNKVKILRGDNRGKEGELREINMDKGVGIVELG